MEVQAQTLKGPLTPEEVLLIDAWRRQDTAMLMAMCQVMMGRAAITAALRGEAQGASPEALLRMAAAVAEGPAPEEILAQAQADAPAVEVPEGEISQAILDQMLAGGGFDEASDADINPARGIVAVGGYRISVGDGGHVEVAGAPEQEVASQSESPMDEPDGEMSQADLDALLGGL